MKIFEVAGEGKLHGLTVMSLDAFVKKEDDVEESDMSGVMHAAKHYNKSFLITAELAEGGKKTFRVRAQSERVARGKFAQHHNQAQVISVKEEGLSEAGGTRKNIPAGTTGIHIVQYSKDNEPKLVKDADEKHVYSTGDWAIDFDVAKTLIGKNISLHKKKDDMSFHGGQIIDVKTAERDKAIGPGVAFVYKANARFISPGFKWPAGKDLSSREYIAFDVPQEGLSEDANFMPAGEYKNYPIEVRKTKFNDKYFIAQGQIGKELIKAKGDTQDDALAALQQLINDRIASALQKPTNSKKKRLVLTGSFVRSMLGKQTKDPFFIKVENSILYVSDTQDSGFIPIEWDKGSLWNYMRDVPVEFVSRAGLASGTRYTIKKIAGQDSAFDLVYYSDITSSNDKQPDIGPMLKVQETDRNLAQEGLKEFALPGGGDGDSGRWYTDDELADIIGDDWFQDFDVSNDGFNIDAYGEKAKQNLVGYANSWFDDKGYNVHVMGVDHNDVDHDLKWYIVGSFHNDNFADKDINEAPGDFGLGANYRAVPDDEMQDLMGRSKNKTKTKRDKFDYPYIHGSNIEVKDEAGKKFDTEKLKAAIMTRPANILGQNAKMQHSETGTEAIFDIGLPALKGLAVNEKTGEFVVVDTCPGAGACQTYCYAMKGSYVMFKAVSMGLARMLNFLLNDPAGFADKLNSEIASARSKYAKKGAKIVVRWHDAGDFFSPEYMDMAYGVAKSNPDVGFYAYTKMGDVANAARPANFNMNFSQGAKSGQEKKVNITRTKHSKVVPKDMFFDLIARKGNELIKDAKGRMQFASPENLEKFKSTLAQKYAIDKDSILTYDQMMKIPVGAEPKWNVIVMPGDGDNSANRNDVIGSYLLFH